MAYVKSIEVEFLDDLQKLAEEFTVDLVKELNDINPVLTGLSRSNWHVSQTPTSAVYPIDSPANVIRAARSAIKYKVKAVNTFYIGNNTSYIVSLANGSSPQAARGWIERSLYKMADKHYA